MKGLNFVYIFLGVLMMVLLVASVIRLWNIRLNPDAIDHPKVPDTVIFSLTEPKVTDTQILGYLQGKVHSRLRGRESKFFELGLMHDIDPAFAVAVSEKETSLGRATCKGVTRNCYNFFCLKHDDVKLTGLSRGKCAKTEWAHFETAEDGIEAFFLHVNGEYIDKNPSQDTISKIGCGPDSGFGINCYCTMTGSDCGQWVSQVTALTEQIRSYALEA